MILTGGAAAAALAGCLGEDDPDAGNGEEHANGEHAGVEADLEAYVVAYHWGYAVFDENGDELDLIEVAPNTELTLHAVNDHAYDAFGALPDPIVAKLEDFDGLARTKAKVEAGDFPEPNDATVEEVYQEAHGHGHDDHDDGHDDGHDDDHNDGHDDGHDHEDAMLDHGFALQGLDVTFQVPVDADTPTTESVVVEEPGTYEAFCTVPCGHYHGHQRQDLVHVTDDA